MRGPHARALGGANAPHQPCTRKVCCANSDQCVDVPSTVQHIRATTGQRAYAGLRLTLAAHLASRHRRHPAPGRPTARDHEGQKPRGTAASRNKQPDKGRSDYSREQRTQGLNAAAAVNMPAGVFIALISRGVRPEYHKPAPSVPLGGGKSPATRPWPARISRRCNARCPCCSAMSALCIFMLRPVRLRGQTIASQVTRGTRLWRRHAYEMPLAGIAMVVVNIPANRPNMKDDTDRTGGMTDCRTEDEVETVKAIAAHSHRKSRPAGYAGSACIHQSRTPTGSPGMRRGPPVTHAHRTRPAKGCGNSRHYTKFRIEPQ